MVESFGFSLPVVVLNLFEIIATLESFANIFQFHAIFGSWREGSTDGVKRAYSDCELLSRNSEEPVDSSNTTEIGTATCRAARALCLFTVTPKLI